MSLDSALTIKPERPLVTVVMPTFNAARTVRRAIDSVVAQTYPAWNLICVDDASMDATPEIVASYAAVLGDRLTLRRLKANHGPAYARNQGLDAATGTWVAVLDADDAWAVGRLETLVRVAAQSAADVVCDNLVGFDDHGQQHTMPLFEALPSRLDIGALVAAEYQGRYNLGYLKPMMRRSFLVASGSRYDETLRTGEDLLFLLTCLARGGRVSCHSAPGYIYTTPVGDRSRKLSRSTSTSPRDAELAAALRLFLTRSFGLSHRDRDAILHRIAYLEAIAPLALFRHARLSHDWRAILRIVCASSQVRRRIWSSLLAVGHQSPGART